MTTSTLNRVAAPLAAATLATTAVVAPIAATVEPTLPTFSTANIDVELTSGTVFNPNVPLFNPESLGSTALTPLPQILLNGLQNPLGFLPTLETLAPYLMALPAVPGALAIAGPDYLLHALAADNPGLADLASGYDEFAQTIANGLSGLPLVGEPIHTAFAALPVLSQLLTASVINPFPTLFDTSDFWQGLVSGGGIGDLLGGAEATAFAEPNFLLQSLASDFVANPAASTEFLGFDLSGVQDFLTGLPNINDILGFSLSDALGPLGVLLAPLDVIGLGLMIPMALPLVGMDLLFGGGLDFGDLLGGLDFGDLFGGLF